MGDFRKLGIAERGISFFYLPAIMCVYTCVYGHKHTHIYTHPSPTCLRIFIPSVCLLWAVLQVQTHIFEVISAHCFPMPWLILGCVTWLYHLPRSCGLWRGSGCQPKLYKKLFHFYHFVSTTTHSAFPVLHQRGEINPNLHAVYDLGTWSWSWTNTGLV